MPPPAHLGGLLLLPPLISTASLPPHVSAPLFLGPTPHLITPLISLSITIVHPHGPPRLGLSAKTTEHQAFSFQKNPLLSQKTCPEFPRPTAEFNKEAGSATHASLGTYIKFGRAQRGRPASPRKPGRSQKPTGLGGLPPGLVYFKGL